MARPLRIEYPGAVYHITARGNERKEIYRDKEDHERYIEILGRMGEKYGVVVYAYALMKNHYHLLLETKYANLSRVMRDLNGEYTIYFNRKYKRAGHLFQGRYFSILVDKENYLVELSRYIHLNPVRIKKVNKAEEYRHSSMKYYIGKEKTPVWLDTSFILSYYGNNLENQRENYRGFVNEGIKEIENPIKDSYARIILGSENFIERIRRIFLNRKKISKEVPENKELKYGKRLEEISRVIACYYNIDQTYINRKKIKFNKGKRVFIYFSKKYTDAKLSEIVAFLGNNVTESGISKLYNTTEKDILRDHILKKEAEEIESRLFSNIS